MASISQSLLNLHYFLLSELVQCHLHILIVQTHLLMNVNICGSAHVAKLTLNNIQFVFNVTFLSDSLHSDSGVAYVALNSSAF